MPFDKQYWEQHWQGRSDGPGSTHANPPNPYLERETGSLPPGTALDAGCGSGAEAIWLASHGWRVTAADISSEALANAAERATTSGAVDLVEWIEADLSVWNPDAHFDLVTTHYAHPAMPQLDFYDRIATWVAPGGTLPAGVSADEGRRADHRHRAPGQFGQLGEERLVGPGEVEAGLSLHAPAQLIGDRKDPGWSHVHRHEAIRDVTLLDLHGPEHQDVPVRADVTGVQAIARRPVLDDIHTPGMLGHELAKPPEHLDEVVLSHLRIVVRPTGTRQPDTGRHRRRRRVACMPLRSSDLGTVADDDPRRIFAAPPEGKWGPVAQQFTEIDERRRRFIEAQQMFFVGTAARDGRVNVSPKGLDCLRVLSPTRVVWLNGTGSGNETAAHLLDLPRMTLMFCSFVREPLILRLYGTARTLHPGDPEWDHLLAGFPPLAGARNLVDLDVDLVQTSCGYGVPLYDHVTQRDLMDSWATKKGPEGLRTYQQEHNLVSIDGLPTGLPLLP